MHITHRKEQLLGPERVIHPSGKLCKTHNKGGYWDDELPDLVPPTPSTTVTNEILKETLVLKSPPKATRCSRRISSRLVATPVTCVASLLSGFFPEAASTVTSRPETTTATLNTGTLQMAKSHDQPIISSTSAVLSGYLTTAPTRNVTTTPRVMKTPKESLTSAFKTSTTLDITSPEKIPGNEESTTRNTRTVPTNEAEIPDGITLESETGQTRIVTTDENDQLQPDKQTEIVTLMPDDVDEMDLLEINEAAVKRSALHDLLDDPTPSRDVTTAEIKQSQPPDTDETECNTSDSRVVTTCTTHPAENPASPESQENITPLRAGITEQIISDREPSDLEVAETLLQLHDATSPEPSSENEQLLPVDAPKQVDIVKEMEAEKNNNSENLPDLPHVHDPAKNLVDNSDDDDADTIIYEQTVTPTRETSSVISPRRGKVTFKHYGIPRRSPKQTIIRKHCCLVCGKSKNSKKELNDHHRKEHSSIICPTCGKEFATADSYQRHRYVHRNPVQHKCNICDKILPFESDLQRHLRSHTEGTRWYCSHTPCKRNFKRKADLDLHEVIHTGVLQKCTWLGCKYSNLDPRNVKRHQKSHTQKATVHCPKCEQVFVFYMQMKRHRDQDH